MVLATVDLDLTIRMNTVPSLPVTAKRSHHEVLTTASSGPPFSSMVYSSLPEAHTVSPPNRCQGPADSMVLA